ncbi:MAG: hypothetical protein PHF46_03950 [Candidatus Gracilibacteria bacterium]|nr:hypothetical protein [Candidatus Gracilibacteria bacterium]MDD3120535.1 hypothetical protein [Candidatus Gracilibacteria bacterium]MDD4530797.1 hypothetical protein [Candidatus Gracilibacteria bacterium]
MQSIEKTQVLENIEIDNQKKLDNLEKNFADKNVTLTVHEKENIGDLQLRKLDNKNPDDKYTEAEINGAVLSRFDQEIQKIGVGVNLNEIKDSAQYKNLLAELNNEKDPAQKLKKYSEFIDSVKGAVGTQTAEQTKQDKDFNNQMNTQKTQYQKALDEFSSKINDMRKQAQENQQKAKTIANTAREKANIESEQATKNMVEGVGYPESDYLKESGTA